MKTGKSLEQMARELTRIKATAKDFIVPTERISAEAVINTNAAVPIENERRNPTGSTVMLSFANGTKHRFGLTGHAAAQTATYTDIPKAYFDRIATENPVLLADSINHGLERATKKAKGEGKSASRMLRTLDGNVRGMLSSRYRILDSYDMLDAVLPTMLDKGMQVVSSELTDSRLFIKALSPRLQSEVKKGDVVQFGLVISTSDVGAGSVRVEPLLYRLICLNGMISDTAIRKFHIGKNQAEEDIRELLSDSTRELSDSAFWAQVRDVVIGSMRPEHFEKQVDKLRVAANEEIKNFDLPRVVELTMKATGITGEGKKNGILAALANGNEGAGLTRWGLINSFTRAAQADDVSYEESIEMERAGGAILELPRSAWQTISSVA